MDKERVIVVGGVAGGASTAARLRREAENIEIVMIERGKYASFANCGLPYRVGDVIDSDDKLLVAKPALFNERFNIDVMLETSVDAVNAEDKTVTVTRADGSQDTLSYTRLVLATGASAIVPPWPGVDHDRVYLLRTIPDMERVRAIAHDGLEAGHVIGTDIVRRAVIVGGGFVGLELAENLAHLGLEVTILEFAPQLMPPMDGDMARYVEQRLSAEPNISVFLGDGVSSFEVIADEEQENGDDVLRVRTAAGASYPCAFAVLAIGVRPESTLASSAGLELGVRGSVVVDPTMKTSDDSIYAVGDLVQVMNRVTQTPMTLALAGPANRQGRIAADAIAASLGLRSALADSQTFHGVLGTWVCGVFELAAAGVGANERALNAAGIAYDKVYIHPGHHVSYYPGAHTIHLKLLFSVPDGRVLGAQAVGQEGVDKRIDVIASYMAMGATVHDLAQAELCYSPQFGAAKDPVNLIAMVATNHLSGSAPLAQWDQIAFPEDATTDAVSPVTFTGKNLDGQPEAPAEAILIDVRSPGEVEKDPIPGALNMPVNDMRALLDQGILAPYADTTLLVFCRVGRRANVATRLLRNLGHADVRNISGGTLSFVH